MCVGCSLSSAERRRFYLFEFQWQMSIKNFLMKWQISSPIQIRLLMKWELVLSRAQIPFYMINVNLKDEEMFFRCEDLNQKFCLTKMPLYFFSNWKLWSDLCNSYFVKHCNAFRINSINEAYLCASVFERNLYVALLLQGDQIKFDFRWLHFI